jgi:hypothetical protein
MNSIFPTKRVGKLQSVFNDALSDLRNSEVSFNKDDIHDVVDNINDVFPGDDDAKTENKQQTSDLQRQKSKNLYSKAQSKSLYVYPL